MAKGEKYVSGAMQAPLAVDEDGNATERIERDADGQLWHCTDDTKPVAVSKDEAAKLVASSDLNVNAKPEGDAEDDG